MKIVWHSPEGNYSENLSEAEAYALTSDLESIEPATEYEFARGYIDNQLVVIYKDNRVLRTKNTWYEYRGIAALASRWNEEFLHSYRMTWKGYDTEIDAISQDHETAIELKRETITSQRLEFLKDKATSLGFSKLVVIAPDFTSTCVPDSSVQLLQFRPSWEPIKQYYNEDFTVWDKFWQSSSQRHFRFLLANGTWKPQRRRYTDTAKWDVADRMIHEINFYHRIKKPPIKIYFSLSRMVSPLREYEGRGRPIDLYLPVLDVDGTHDGNHLIGSEGYCSLCMDDARKKLDRLRKSLQSEDYQPVILHSGTKGFHIYLLKDGMLQEVRKEEMERIVKSNDHLVDTFLSKKSLEFDSHRIFKVPYSVDATTGKLVAPEEVRLPLDDVLTEI